MSLRKKIILLIVTGLSSFFIFFLIFISLISMIFIGGGGGNKKNNDESEIDTLIEIKITGDYINRRGNLTISGTGIKIKNIKGNGTESEFTAKTNGKKGQIVRAEYTAFGPPWNAMEGGGKNAVDSSSQDKDLADGKFICAAPSSVPFWTRVTVGGTGTEQDGRVYITKDRGGAIIISGNIYHFDLLMKTRTEQNSFGRRRGNAMIGESNNTNLKIKIVGKKKVTIKGTANGSDVFAEGTYKNGKIVATGWFGDGTTSGSNASNYLHKSSVWLCRFRAFLRILLRRL